MDLSTVYLGLALPHPLLPSASPLSDGLARLRKLEDAGAAAVVLHSLFEEQIEAESHELDHFLDYGSDSFAEALSYVPDLPQYHGGPDEYLELVRRGTEALGIPSSPTSTG